MESVANLKTFLHRSANFHNYLLKFVFFSFFLIYIYEKEFCGINSKPIIPQTQWS